MKNPQVKNVVASVLAKLRNTSKSSGVAFQQVLQQYAMERFLYRVSKSKHATTVILKGALLLKTVGIPRARPTLDIDMLRKGEADQTSLIGLVKDCATSPRASSMPATLIRPTVIRARTPMRPSIYR